MHSFSYSSAEFLGLIEKINNIYPFALTIVDTTGSMKEKDILSLYYLTDSNLDKNISLAFHSHNGQQLSFSNAQSFMKINTDRHLIIDSKVTLTSYLEYIKDPDKIKEFKTEVKKRITDLANKNYQNAGDLSQPDFVLMYMPVETSVNLLYEDYDLISSAYKSNIIIVGTASLLTAIRLVNQLLAQQKQNESVNQIVNAGTNLYETFVQFCEDLIDVQKRFDGVSTQLNKTINRFKRGNKNKPSLFSQVETLKEYGINSVKEIPSDLLIEEDIMEKDSAEELDGVFANE
jgi:DNA recombination protein RmuC